MTLSSTLTTSVGCPRHLVESCEMWISPVTSSPRFTNAPTLVTCAATRHEVPETMPADHVSTPALSAVGEYECKVIDPASGGYSSDAFGSTQVRPYREACWVTAASGAYASPIGMVVS